MMRPWQRLSILWSTLIAKSIALPQIFIVSDGTYGAGSGALSAANQVRDRWGSTAVGTEGFYDETLKDTLDDSAEPDEFHLQKGGVDSHEKNSKLADIIVAFRPDKAVVGGGITESQMNLACFGFSEFLGEESASKKARGPLHLGLVPFMERGGEEPPQFQTRNTIYFEKGAEYPGVPEQAAPVNLDEIAQDAFTEWHIAEKSGMEFLMVEVEQDSIIDEEWAEAQRKTNEENADPDAEIAAEERRMEWRPKATGEDPKQGLNQAAAELQQAIHKAMGSGKFETIAFKILVVGSKEEKGSEGFINTAEYVLSGAINGLFQAHEDAERRSQMIGMVVGVVIVGLLVAGGATFAANYRQRKIHNPLMPGVRPSSATSEVESGIELPLKSSA